jgi:hemolysin D
MKSADDLLAAGPEPASRATNVLRAMLARLHRPATRAAEELAFLPAALEIVETPPPPAAGKIELAVVALMGLALAWACLGRIDIVATAPGRILPSGRTKVIQPFETGVVRAIHVRDGQAVTAGEVLIELDPTMNDAERKHLEGDLATAELDVARLTAALSEDTDPLAAFHPPENLDAAMVATQRHFLINQIEEHRAKLAALDRQKSQKEAELATVNATVAKLETILPVLDQRVDIRQSLLSHETGSKAYYLELLQAQVEMQQDLLVQKSRSTEAQAALAAITESRAQTDAEFRRTLSGELVEAQRKVAGLTEDIVKAGQRTKLQVLAAPVDGAVQQLSVHTVGGVVTPAQSLLVVVPADSRIEIEAMVSNRDIGFVHVGQDVEIKIDTFNFTRYGLIHGKVLSLSQDAITRDKPQDRSDDQTPGATTTSSEPKGQEMVYAARISLDRTQMQIEENLVNLSPGMAVTAEIRTGSRAIISYLLSPLLKYHQESLRER